MAKHGLVLVENTQGEAIEAPTENEPAEKKRKGSRRRGKKKPRPSSKSARKKPVDGGAAADGEATQGKGKKGNGKPGNGKPGKGSPRKRVKNAQITVLDAVDDIVKGSCASAAGGNYGCAKFVLDWAGVSDLRTPLGRPLKPKSGTSALIKKLQQAMKNAQPPQQELPK